MGIRYKDMEGLVKPIVHIDEFSSKIGDDADLSVISFYTINEQVAKDLEKWFEQGYEFVIDADTSPGEVKPNRYIVYVEIPRGIHLVSQIKELLIDLETITEHKLKDWDITYDKNTVKFDSDTLKHMIYLTPMAYRMDYEKDLNEMRTAANIPVKSFNTGKDTELDNIKIQAGIL